MAWKFVLCELPTVALGGAVIGAVENATDRRVFLQLNGMPTASFTIRMDNPMATEITDREGDVMLKVYQHDTDTAPLFIGDCLAADEVGSEEQGVSLACSFAGPLWRLSKRLKGTSITGEGTTYSSTVRRDQMLEDMVAGANAQHDTGIRLGTLATLREMPAGPWLFKPISEAFAELAASYAPAPFETVSSPTYHDAFAGTPSSALSGRTSTSGHTWTSTGTSPTDFVLDAGGNFLARFGPADGATTGRFGLLGSATTDQLIQCDVARGGTVGAPTTVLGLVGRYTNTSNYVRFDVVTDIAGAQYFELYKFVGGTPTLLWQSDYGDMLPASFLAAMRMVIDSDGRYALWWWPLADTSYQSNPIMVGQDADLATGGTLASGQSGIYGFNIGPGTPDNDYDNYFSTTPAESLDAEALEFELVPAEPVVDTASGTLPAGSIKIATLNADVRIGSDKPNVIFEYGDGNRSIKSYKRAISRESLMTRGYVLPQGVETPWPTGALVERSNSDAITARGQYEDVVATDVGTGQSAVLDFHLFFRRQARQIITFDPSASNPYVYGTDYSVGDSVTGRAKFNGVERFNGLFRVYAVEITIDDEGKETVSPTLTLD